MMGEIFLSLWELLKGILLMGWNLIVTIATWLMNLWR